jgi:hypothetical protein
LPIYWDLANKYGLDTAPDLPSWPLPGGAYPVSRVHENDQYNQTLQQPNSAQSSAFLSGSYTSVLNYNPPCFDPNIQVPWSSLGMQPLGNIPSQGYSEQIQHSQCPHFERIKIEAYDPILLPTPQKKDLLRVPEASCQSCQSDVSQREDLKRMQIAVLRAESKEAVAIPAVADFDNLTTQSTTEIRSVRYI